MNRHKASFLLIRVLGRDLVVARISHEVFISNSQIPDYQKFWRPLNLTKFLKILIKFICFYGSTEFCLATLSHDRAVVAGAQKRVVQILRQKLLSFLSKSSSQSPSATSNSRAKSLMGFLWAWQNLWVIFQNYGLAC